MADGDDKLAILQDIGFTAVGSWKLAPDGIDCELGDEADSKNALYAFTVDDQLMYIGKTTQTLRKRLAGYKNPSPTQATNIRNHGYIRESLLIEMRLDIYIFRDMGLLRYGGFHLNLAAGLEDSLIIALSPPWNGGKKDEPDEDATVPQAPSDNDDITVPAVPVIGAADADRSAPDKDPAKPRTSEFEHALSILLAEASRSGVPHLDVRAGNLHKTVGGYDGPNHRMVPCCNAMRKMLQTGAGGKVLHRPPKGNGANLVIRYFLPRLNK